LKKEVTNSMKFNKENLDSKLNLVTKEEFLILKKIIEKHQKEINFLKNKKKIKKAKKP
jgi:hypothetical protein